MLANTEILNKKIAYVAINCERGFEQFVTNKLQSIDVFIELQNTVGNYVILTKIETSS